MTKLQLKTVIVGVLKGWFPNKNAINKLYDNDGYGEYNDKKITISESPDNLLSEDETGIFLDNKKILTTDTYSNLDIQRAITEILNSLNGEETILSNMITKDGKILATKDSKVLTAKGGI